MTSSDLPPEVEGSEDDGSVEPPAPTARPDPPSHHHETKVTRAGAVWVATAVSLFLLVLLIVFILQNQTSVALKFLGFDGDVPVGVAMLIAAVAGGVLVALAGGARVLQLRRALRRTQSAGTSTERG